MPFQLTITEGKGHGQNFYFDRPLVKIGRLPDNDLVLYDTGVSRYHCEILSARDSFTLRDAGSSNGTLLNDVVTTEGEIRAGDRIGVGPITFIFNPTQETARTRKRLSRQMVDPPPDEPTRKALEEDRTSAIPRSEVAQALAQTSTPKRKAQNVLRTATGSFITYQRKVGGRWRLLPKQTRWAMVLATFVIVAGFVASAYIVQSTPPNDRSGEVFPISDDTAILKFGAGRVDVFTPDQVSFAFGYDGGLATLTYAATDIASEREVEIRIGGQKVGEVPVAQKWTKGLTLELPRRTLKPGRNVITFDNLQTPQREDEWGISQVHVRQTPLPPANPEAAKDQYELGKAAFDTRSVAPPNLYRSITYYRQALRLLEGLDPIPPLYAEIQSALTTSEEELQRVHDSHMFAAEKAARFGDQAQAADTLRALLNHYPDADDRRHQVVKERLGELLGGGP